MMDFRRRNLIVLGVLALVSVALAGLMLTIRAQDGRARFTPGEFLPGFAAHVKDATRIHIVSRDGAFDVDYLPAKGSWILPESGNYPADFERVRQTLIGLAAWKPWNPRRPVADWLPYIGLDAPPKGSGTAITVTGKAGNDLSRAHCRQHRRAGECPGRHRIVCAPSRRRPKLSRSRRLRLARQYCRLAGNRGDEHRRRPPQYRHHHADKRRGIHGGAGKSFGPRIQAARRARAQGDSPSIRPRST